MSPPMPPVPVPPPGWQSLLSLRHFFDGHCTSVMSVQPPMSSQMGVTWLSPPAGQVVIPQVVPAGWFPLSTHWGTPVEHEVT